MPTRRDFLLGAAALVLVREGLAQGKVKTGVQTVRGEATINGQPAKPGMAVNAGDKVATGKDAQIVFVMDRDAMLARQNSNVEVAKNGFRLVSGAVLSVFAPNQKKEVRTSTATIGIRGTAVYLEARDRKS